jgi:4-hydroxybenzoate polyprenyltransferase
MKLSRRTDWIGLWCAAFAAVITVLFYALWPNATAWAYFIVWIAVTALIYQAVIKSKARETVINRKDRE